MKGRTEMCLTGRHGISRLAQVANSRGAAPLLAALAAFVCSGGSAPPPPGPQNVVAIRNGASGREEFSWGPTGLQTALDSIRFSGGIVQLRQGVYTITRPLTVWSGTTLLGNGLKTEIRLLGPLNTGVRALRVGSHCVIANLTLRGTGYEAADPKPYGSTGIIGGVDELGNMDSTTIEGCRLVGWNTNAINLAPRSRHNTIRNNSIDSCGWEGVYLAQFCDSNTVVGNAITACRHNAIDVVGSRNSIVWNVIRDIGTAIPDADYDTYGILVYSKASVTGPVSDNVVRGNTISNSFDGISVLASNDSDNQGEVIAGNAIYNSRRYGIRIGGTGAPPRPRISQVRVDSNLICTSSADGILLDRIPRSVAVRGNRFLRNSGAGIRLSAVEGGTDSCVISGNVSWGNGTYGVDVGALVRRTVISNNVLHEATGAGIHDGGTDTKAADNQMHFAR